MPKARFELKILSAEGLIFHDQVESLYLYGHEGEFELLPYHFPLIAALPEGNVEIANHGAIPIKEGIVFFKQNSCKLLIDGDNLPLMKTWGPL
jgi:F0F1-type ATP synthase epsilon subunit